MAFGRFSFLFAIGISLAFFCYQLTKVDMMINGVKTRIIRQSADVVVQIISVSSGFCQFFSLLVNGGEM